MESVRARVDPLLSELETDSHLSIENQYDYRGGLKAAARVTSRIEYSTVVKLAVLGWDIWKLWDHQVVFAP